MPNKITTPSDYRLTLTEIVEAVNKARYESFKAVNKHLVDLYYEIGKIITEKEQNGHWGDRIVEKLAKDLQTEFAGVRGFSARNMWNMKKFYERYNGSPKLQTLSAEITWSANVLIMEYCKTNVESEFYLRQSIQNAWSVRMLEKKLKLNEYQNILNSQTNFEQVLAPGDTETAIFAIKDNYNLDFLELTEKHKERQLEDGIVNNIVRFLNEMGGMFAFLGRQIKLELNGKEYFIDLLFYHRILRCLIVVELKTVEFEPEHMGKMQFYLTMADEQLRREEEKASIGIIICRYKDRTLVEYTLRDVSRPIGVATYTYNELPIGLAKYLPSEADFDTNFDI
jgi:predicted nuclease of restriction endonuclease-like (RecB) superfamily